MPCVTATIQGPEEQNGGNGDPTPDPGIGNGGFGFGSIVQQITSNPTLAAAGVGAGALIIGIATRGDGGE